MIITLGYHSNYILIVLVFDLMKEITIHRQNVLSIRFNDVFVA